MLVATLLALPLALASAALWCRKRRLAHAPLAPVGRAASVEETLSPEGSVLVSGELWRARSASGRHVARGSTGVRVVGARGHLLIVAGPGDTEKPI